MVGAARFELATSRSQTERSTKLSHAPSFSAFHIRNIPKCRILLAKSSLVKLKRVKIA